MTKNIDLDDRDFQNLSLEETTLEIERRVDRLREYKTKYEELIKSQYSIQSDLAQYKTSNVLMEKQINKLESENIDLKSENQKLLETVQKLLKHLGK